MGPSPILSVIHTVIIGTMLKNNGHGIKTLRVKQTLRPSCGNTFGSNCQYNLFDIHDTSYTDPNQTESFDGQIIDLKNILCSLTDN